MRILHVAGPVAPRYGGPSEAIFRMARAVAERGHDVRLLTVNLDGPRKTMNVPQNRWCSYQGVETLFLPAVPPHVAELAPETPRVLRDVLPDTDVVHVHSVYRPHCIFTYRAARTSRVPYVVRPHGSLDEYHRSRHRRAKAAYHALFLSRFIRNAAGVHLTSPYEEQASAELLGNARRFIVPLGVDLADLIDREAKRPGWWPDSGRVVLFLGRFAEKKQIPFLVESFSLLPSRETDWLVLAGSENRATVDSLRALCERHGIADRVIFPGFLSGSAKQFALSNAHIFALPSKDENFGVAVLEAIATGCLVVTTSAVGSSDAVRITRAGEVLDDPTPAEFAHVIRGLLHQRRPTNRHDDVASLTWSSVAQQLEQMYESAASGR